MKKCRICKIDLNEDYGVYENADDQKRYYCFIHWNQYYYSITKSENEKDKKIKKIK